MNVSSLYAKTNDQTILFQTVYRIIDSKLDIVRHQMNLWMARLQPSSHQQNNVDALELYDIVTYTDLSLPKNSNTNVFGVYRKYSDIMYQLENMKIELNEANLEDVMTSLNKLDISEVEKISEKQTASC